jgi:hypothetical protein
VDFENVQPEDMDLLQAGDAFKVKIFIGANQVKIPISIARALQSLGSDAEYIQIDGNGSNALDFHIAYYMGRLAIECPDSFFHVISKDTGFDPLIKHLKKQKVFCQRSISIGDIPLVKSKNMKSVEEKIEVIIDNLIKRGASKPRTLKTLCSSVKAQFVNQVTEEDVAALVKQLEKRGVLVINEGKVSYHLS